MVMCKVRARTHTHMHAEIPCSGLCMGVVCEVDGLLLQDDMYLYKSVE